jgi:hypothetical protein
MDVVTYFKKYYDFSSLIQFRISIVNVLLNVLTNQNTDKKIWCTFWHKLLHHITKIEIKNQLEHGETKQTNLVKGKLNQLT